MISWPARWAPTPVDGFSSISPISTLPTGPMCWPPRARLEDLGVAAYNGAAALLTDPALLAALASIVSVEARHASAIRDFIQPANAVGGFAGDDVVDASGLDRAMQPSQVLAAAAPFIPAAITSPLP